MVNASVCKVQAIEVGDVVSRYKFWLTRGKDGTPVPRMYEMKGYDNLIGSHYDKYVLHYLEFDQNKPDPTCKSNQEKLRAARNDRKSREMQHDKN